jgi:hypothetical protein
MLMEVKSPLVTAGTTARDLAEWLRPLTDGTILNYRLSITNGGILAHHPYYSDHWRRFELPVQTTAVWLGEDD